jgi:nucleotide-binding universal stress UspA family protein
MPKHILIPTDGSETAQKGVDYGLALARDLGAKVTVVTATDPYPMPVLALGAGWIPSEEEMNDYNAAQKAAADKLLRAVKEAADKLGVHAASVHVADIRPADAILETARARGAQLIVMASHGRRGVSRLVLGSQAAEVVALADVPVLVVK